MGSDKLTCKTVCSLMLTLCLKVGITFKEDIFGNATKHMLYE